MTALNYFQIALVAVLLSLYFVKDVLYYTKFHALRKYSWILVSLAVITNIVIVAACGYFLASPWVHLNITLIFALIEFKMIFRADFRSVLYMSGHYVFYLFIFRGIVLNSFSLITNINIREIIVGGTLYFWIFSIALIVVLIFLEFSRRKRGTDENVKQVFRNKEQLTFIAIYQILLTAFLFIINRGKVYDWAIGWYALSHLIARIVILFVRELIVHYTYRINRLMQHERNTHLLQEQLTRQMHHYKSYQKYTESFRIFKHDYKGIMTSVKSLLNNGEIQKANKLIDNIHDELQKNVLIHKSYSNNILLDAILQDMANACEENNIRFSAVAYFPEGIELEDIKICKIFSNLLRNAAEACLKVPNEKRFIEIKSSKVDSWATIEIINSFDGRILIENGELETTKSNKEFHGLGLKVVKDIVEELGGVVQIETCSEEKVFAIKLHIPHN